MMRSRISEDMVTSVGFGLYLRFREVLEEIKDLTDREDSKIRHLIPYDCFEYTNDLSKESSGGMSD